MAKKDGAAQHKAKVLVVDDHPVVCDGLVQRINSEEDLIVCAAASSSAEALKAVERARPDVAVVDLSLGDESGLELIKDIHQRSPQTRLLVLSMHNPVVYAERAVRAGARGYVMKEEGTGKVIQGIRKVLAGEVFFRSDILSQILSQITESPAQGGKSATSSLTDRELEVFRMIGQGMSTKSVARKMHRSTKTVEAHREHIKEKLGVHNSEELLQYAIQWVQGEETR